MAKPILDGSLKEPIYRKTFPDEESFKQEQQRRFELLCAKLSVEWRGPEATDWKALATRLAHATVPGLSRPRSGRPSAASKLEFGWVREQVFLIDLLAAWRKHCPRLGLTAAAKRFAKSPRVLPERFKKLEWEALRKKLAAAIKQETEYLEKVKRSKAKSAKIRETTPKRPPR